MIDRAIDFMHYNTNKELIKAFKEKFPALKNKTNTY
jgi:hypothetical protein